VTLASALLSIGVIGAGVAFWLPTYLEQVRHLTVEGVSAYMGIQVVGGFVGCVSAGYILDWLGRRRGLALFALGSALAAWAYVVLPLGAAWLVFAIGFPLGFFSSGIFSGLAVYLADCTRPSCVARDKGSATTSAGGSARSGRPRSAPRRRGSG
jgi:sugar phosphate permease